MLLVVTAAVLNECMLKSDDEVMIIAVVMIMVLSLSGTAIISAICIAKLPTNQCRNNSVPHHLLL